MVVILIAWCLITVLIKGFQPVPWPVCGSLNFGSDAFGWLKGRLRPDNEANAEPYGNKLTNTQIVMGMRTKASEAGSALTVALNKFSLRKE
jgi:hypothetical protein